MSTAGHVADKGFKSDENCIFCKIVKGQIPSFKLIETSSTIAFFDINPIGHGHSLVIPKHHGAKLSDLPDDSLKDILPVAKLVVEGLGLNDYNILQNNGRIAHQEVDHVHFHVIPKVSERMEEGLVIKWTQLSGTDMKILGEKAVQVKTKIEQILRDREANSNL
ncbi:HIT-like domain-containing protein [Phakopsora pachyrhizi]|nr:HIT-like domain-containing protein [Phakopsora pachyrhizi]